MNSFKRYGGKKEARIVVPVGNRPAVNYVAEFLMDKFNGFTSFPTFGGWRDNEGRVHLEPGTAFDVAMVNNQANRGHLIVLAEMLVDGFGEQSVYLRMPNGEVVFIEKEPIVEKKADANSQAAIAA